MKKFLLFSFITLFFSAQAQQAGSFEHSWWQWVEGSKISDKRLNEIAPHFPKPEAYNFSHENYDLAIAKWQRLYCFEYEALINAPELVALNPYYTGYQDIVQMPYFIRPLSSYEKPTKKDTGNSFEDELEHELDIQAWYFVFHPDEFYQMYGVRPELPAWFDIDDYRAQIIKKIEESKKQSEK